MATKEERMRVLRLVEQGKISAEEGARLLAALGKGAGKRQRPRGPAPDQGDGRWIRLRVADRRSGGTRVNMSLPLGMVKMGLAIGARFVPDVADLDIDQLQAALRSGRSGKILEVTGEDGEVVEIFIE